MVEGRRPRGRHYYAGETPVATEDRCGRGATRRTGWRSAEAESGVERRRPSRALSPWGAPRGKHGASAWILRASGAPRLRGAGRHAGRPPGSVARTGVPSAAPATGGRVSERSNGPGECCRAMASHRRRAGAACGSSLRAWATGTGACSRCSLHRHAWAGGNEARRVEPVPASAGAPAATALRAPLRPVLNGHRRRRRAAQHHTCCCADCHRRRCTKKSADPPDAAAGRPGSRPAPIAARPASTSRRAWPPASIAERERDRRRWGARKRVRVQRQSSSWMPRRLGLWCRGRSRRAAARIGDEAHRSLR